MYLFQAALETVENESDEGTSALRGNHKRRRSSGEEDGIEDSSEEQKDSIRAEVRILPLYPSARNRLYCDFALLNHSDLMPSWVKSGKVLVTKHPILPE